MHRTEEDDVEDREALASRLYLDSIEDAREDYRSGNTISLRDFEASEHG